MKKRYAEPGWVRWARGGVCAKILPEKRKEGDRHQPICISVDFFLLHMDGTGLRIQASNCHVHVH